MLFREWTFLLREWNFEFRELLREYPGTLRDLREWPFHSESVFPEIGVVPRLLTEGVSEGFLKGPRPVRRRALQNPFKTLPRTLRKPVMKVSNR